jgi:outer membrane protein TolC
MILPILKPHWLAATIACIGARSMSVMGKPVATARGPHHTFSDFTPWIANAITKACLIITILLAMAGGAITWCSPAQGAETRPGTQPLTPGNPLTFEDSVKIAINQSPYFTKSSLEIDLRRLDETDSRYGMVPPLTFRTYYYVNPPRGPGYSSHPYSLSFSTDPYNPLGTYFTLQANKLASQLAILTHLGTISKGLEQLGQLYLKLDAMQKVGEYQKDIIKLGQENLTYVNNRMSIGTGTSLDVKVAQQELQLDQGEQERIALSQKRDLSSLKNLLGLPSNQAFTPNFRDSRRQVLGTFDPATESLEQTKNRSYVLKAFEIEKQLQGYNISLAIARIFPAILFTTQTPDPLSLYTAHGLYVGIGLQVPVWDGFKRIRNVSRQKTVLKQIGAMKQEKENFLEDNWLEALGKIQEKKVALKIASSQLDLAQLKAHQQEILYQSGEAPLPVILKGRKEVLSAQKELVYKSLAYDVEVLALRQISGDLGNTYVDASSWQK